MFPLGVSHYLIGGLIIGLGVGLIYVATGLHATQSSFFDTTLSYFSNKLYFKKKEYLDSRFWRIILAIGLIIGASLYTILFAKGALYLTSVQLWRLTLGGFLVGVGTRLSKGCTSGHGISGVASLSTASIFAVITFISVGILTAIIIQGMGILP
ncbi:YeeE/YedE family protein [[Eubacterium] cellulosolvens]